jgi:hypothetical protein
MWVDFAGTTGVAHAWRLASPEELAAYRLAQLAEGGL